MNLCSLDNNIISEIISFIIDDIRETWRKVSAEELFKNRPWHISSIRSDFYRFYPFLQSWTSDDMKYLNNLNLGNLAKLDHISQTIKTETMNYFYRIKDISIFCTLRLVNQHFYKILPKITEIWKMLYPKANIIYQTKKYNIFYDKISGSQISIKKDKLHGIQKRGIFTLILDEHYNSSNNIEMSEWFREHSHGGILPLRQRFKNGKPVIDKHLMGMVPNGLAYGPRYPYSTIKDYFETKEEWKWGRRIRKNVIRVGCKHQYNLYKCNCSNSDGKIVRRKKRKPHGKNRIRDEINEEIKHELCN